MADQLTAVQMVYLANIEAAGPEGLRYSGRAKPVLEALEAKGLITVDWDANLDATKGRLRWHLTAKLKTEAEGTS